MPKSDKILYGHELGKALVDAGVIPEFTRDVIIEIPVHGLVTIHLSAFADREKLLGVMPAAAQGAKVIDHAKEDKKEDDVVHP